MHTLAESSTTIALSTNRPFGLTTHIINHLLQLYRFLAPSPLSRALQQLPRRVRRNDREPHLRRRRSDPQDPSDAERAVLHQEAGELRGRRGIEGGESEVQDRETQGDGVEDGTVRAGEVPRALREGVGGVVSWVWYSYIIVLWDGDCTALHLPPD